MLNFHHNFLIKALLVLLIHEFMKLINETEVQTYYRTQLLH